MRPSPRPPTRPPRRPPRTPCLFPPGGSAVVLVLLGGWASLLSGCGQEAPALEVGPVGFTEAELLGLSEGQRHHLELIARVGLAISRGEELALGAPVLEHRRALRMGERLREEVVLAAAGVTEEELETRYLIDPDVELVVRHLVVLSERWRPEEERARARGRAEEALARIRDGEPFPEVAGEVSEEPGAERRGGLLQPGREGTWVREFWDAAGALDEGGVSPVVETEYGFHVLRLEERRLLPFGEARDRVVGEVARSLGGGEAWEAWLEERREALGVDGEGVAAFDPLAPRDGEILASWPGGVLEEPLGTRRLRGLPRAEWTSFLTGSPPLRKDRIRQLAQITLQEEEAEARGLRLRPATEAGMERDWERKVAGWGVFLGFTRGMSPTAVGDAALEGLRATGQNARIAREEILGWSPALELWDPGPPPPES